MTTLAFMDQATNWWGGLGAARQVFYGIGFLAGFISLILAVLSVVGMGHHDAMDSLGAHESDTLSLKPVIGFFLGFGLAGGMALDEGLSVPVALLIALAAGGALMALIVGLFRAIHSMRSDGTMRVGDALGAVGTVYVTVLPDKAPGGQVVVTFSGRQETFSALSESRTPMPSGGKVKVVKIVDGNTVLVEAL